MQKANIESKVKEVLIRVRNLEINPSDLEDSFADIDSLNLLEFITQIEEEFSIELNDQDVEYQKMNSISSVVMLIKSKKKEKLENKKNGNKTK
jgi:acyl carrier protein